MRTLILSCNTGGGHNTAAKAIKEIFDEGNDYCEIKDALSFGGQFASDLVCDSYIEIVKKTPKLFGEMYKMSGKLGAYNAASEKIRSPVYLVNKIYADALEEYIIQNQFDAVICTHIFPSEAMSHLKKRHNMKVPFYFVATDYYCCPMCEEIIPSLIFTPHKDTEFTYTDKGISPSLILSSGIPVSQKFIRQTDKDILRKEQGFSKEDKIFLLMGGSMGFGDTVDIARYIFENTGSDARIIAVTGSNKELYSNFEQEFKDEKRLVLLGFTDKIPQYMGLSDILITKPGGLSSTEALVKGIPIVHTSPIPGCESENVKFFTEHHLSLKADSPEDAGRFSVMLMNDDFLKSQMLEAQKQYRPQNSARIICDYVKSHI